MSEREGEKERGEPFPEVPRSMYAYVISYKCQGVYWGGFVIQRTSLIGAAPAGLASQLTMVNHESSCGRLVTQQTLYKTSR